MFLKYEVYNMETLNRPLQILLLDGYIDEPGCLGVPPYLAPLPRYIAGTIQVAMDQGFLSPQSNFRYMTIDDFRNWEKSNSTEEQFQNPDVVICVSGVSVPGKYLGGTPISFRELRNLPSLFSDSFLILCGPTAKYGIGGEGGKPSKSSEQLESIFHLILKEDAEIALEILFSEELPRFLDFIDHLDQKYANLQVVENHDYETPEEWDRLINISRSSMGSIRLLAVKGASLLIPQHPNFIQSPEGNLICEIETFRGCPRYNSGGCRFCIEPQKGPTQHRAISSIVEEITALYESGVRHFRLGAQTDFYAYQHGNYDHPKYPRPNPQAIKCLLSDIRTNCPELQTLHIDNVNVLNFTLYPAEAKEITELIVQYCTPGNIAALGVESIDPTVIRMNNLKGSDGEIENAIEVINRYGNKPGYNGNPWFLPGLNFIMGLPGETQNSLQLTLEFLQSLVERDLLVRRINLRKFLLPLKSDPSTQKWVMKHLQKFQSKYRHWKEMIRQTVDHVMLRKIFPFGRVLSQVYAEKHDGKGTLCRQVGTYPITCFVPAQIPLNQYFNLIVVNHGFRSLVCLRHPVKLIELSQKELEAIDGIGKKRAMAIKVKSPKNREDWHQMEPEIVEIWNILEEKQSSK